VQVFRDEGRIEIQVKKDVIVIKLTFKYKL